MISQNAYAEILPLFIASILGGPVISLFALDLDKTLSLFDDTPSCKLLSLRMTTIGVSSSVIIHSSLSENCSKHLHVNK